MRLACGCFHRSDYRSAGLFRRARASTITKRPMAAEPTSTNVPDARRSSSTSDAVHTLLASFLGWTLDAFDFFILIFVLPTIAEGLPSFDPGHRVHDHGDARDAPGWRVDFRLVRRSLWPPAAADGRCHLLLGRRSAERSRADLSLVSCSCAPCYGIGMGGEWGVGASIAMEAVPPDGAGCSPDCCRRATRSAICSRPRAYFLVFPHFGWRPMFFLGGVPALLTLYHPRQGAGIEVVGTNRPPASWRIWRIAASATGACSSIWSLLMTMMNLVSHGTQDLYPTFLKIERGLRSAHGGDDRDHLQCRRADRRAGLRLPLRPYRPPPRDDRRGAGGVLIVPLWIYPQFAGTG